MSHTAAEEPPTFIIDADFLFHVASDPIQGCLPFPQNHSVVHRGVPTTCGVSYLLIQNHSTDFDVTYFLDLNGDALQMPFDCRPCDIAKSQSFKKLELVTRDPCSLPAHITIFFAKAPDGEINTQEDAQVFWTSTPANKAEKAVQLRVQRLPFQRVVEKHIRANTFAARFVRDILEEEDGSFEVDIRAVDCSSSSHGYSLNPFWNASS